MGRKLRLEQARREPPGLTRWLERGDQLEAINPVTRELTVLTITNRVTAARGATLVHLRGGKLSD